MGGEYYNLLIYRLLNCGCSDKEYISFDSVAMAFYEDETKAGSFDEWKEKNRKEIKRKFYSLCNDYKCKYEEHLRGPHSGDFNLIKQSTETSVAA